MTERLKAAIDLAWLVSQHLGPPVREKGRWRWWRCPFHEDKDPSFGVTSDDGRYACFGCGEKGDHLDFLQKYKQLTFPEAKAELAELAGLPDVKKPPPAKGQPAEDAPPCEHWQKSGRAFAAWAAGQLWQPQGEPGLEYLRAGGLTDETIKAFDLGWNPEPLRRDPDRWGLEGDPVYLPRGVTIPCMVAGVLWYVKVRRFDDKGQPEANDGRKYGQPRGSKTALFGADLFQGDRPLLLCEGERDAMLAWQELKDLVDVTTLGGASKGKQGLGRWALWMLPYKRILAAFDADNAGREAAGWWADLSGRVQTLTLSEGNDLADYHRAGGDLRAWLSAAGADAKSDKLAEATAYAAEAESLGIPCAGYDNWGAWLADVEKG